MSRDPRIQDPTQFVLAQHFDTLVSPKMLRSRRRMISTDASPSPSTDLIVNFAYKNNNLYGLGANASGFVKIFDKGGDPIGGSWAASTSGADSGGQRNTKAFSMYHSLLFGLTAGTRIWAYDTAGASFTATAYNLSAYTNTCRGIVTRDDLLLQPFDSSIAMKDGIGAGATANWSTPLTLPSDYVITDICELGDVVAIACRPLTLDKSSKVFLWDKVNTDILSAIDFGKGALMLIDVIDGELVGISETFGTTGSMSPYLASITFRKWTAGPQANIFYEMFGDFNTSVTVSGNHVKVSDGKSINFGAVITMDGTTYRQIWKVGRIGEGFPLAVMPHILVNNDTSINSLEGYFKLDAYNFIAYDGGGAIGHESSSTTFATAYGSVTPTYISQKVNGERFAPGSARRNKKLCMAGLMFDKLLSGQTANLYYRKDGDTSWTQIFSASTAGLNEYEQGVDATGTEFDKGKEYQFKVTTTNGANITGIYYELEILDGDSSEN